MFSQNSRGVRTFPSRAAIARLGHARVGCVGGLCVRALRGHGLHHELVGHWLNSVLFFQGINRCFSKLNYELIFGK